MLISTLAEDLKDRNKVPIPDNEVPKEWFFQGMRGIRKANVPYPYTEWQIDQIEKCANDPLYFFDNYLKIMTLDSGMQPFVTRDYQKEMILRMNTNRFNIFMIPRQAGKSAVCGGNSVWRSLFYEFDITGIVANKAKMSLKMVKDMQFMYANVPFWMQQGIVGWAKGGFELENGSRIISEPTSGTALRGFSIKNLIWDEAAFVPPNLAEEFLSAVYPTIVSSKDSNITLTSTPCGYNHFAKMWFEAKKGTSQFKAFEIHWTQIPGRDEEFKKYTIANIGQQKWNQEFECKIIGSSNTLISGAILETLRHSEPIQVSMDGCFKMYKPFHATHKYVVSADTSAGMGDDYHALSIIDVTKLPYEQVAVYRNNKIKYDSFPILIDRIVRMLPEDSVFICENNGLGLTVLETMNHVYETPCIYYADTPKKLGIYTSRRTKNKGCSVIKDMIEMSNLIIYDLDTIREFYKFIQSGTSYNADKDDETATDDIVMSLVMFGYLVKTPFFKEYFELSNTDRERYQQQLEDDIAESVPPAFGDEDPEMMDVQNQTLNIII